MASNAIDPARLIVPAASWATVKKVVRAYAAASGDDPSGGEVAELAGLQRPVVSACNKFLKSTGILRADKAKLTEAGLQLTTAWSIDNGPMAIEALQNIILSTPSLVRLVNMVRARGSVEKKLLEGQVVLSSGLTKDSFQLPYVKTIVDILEESKLIVIADGNVTPVRNGGVARGDDVRIRGRQEEEEEREQTEERKQEQTETAEGHRARSRTPLPLGSSRLGYLELPADWNPKELPKLVKMINLIFGDGQEQ